MSRLDLATFLEKFARPLACGGELHVSEPIDALTVAEWEMNLDHHAQQLSAIDSAREAVAAQWVVRPPAMAFGGDELRLAAALYDLLVLGHPGIDRWLARDARAKIRQAAMDLCEVSPPDTRREILARHTLLHALFDVHRVDLKLSWWTGSARFQGTKPPTRLTAWPGLRRVREERTVARLHDILAADDADTRVALAILRASPLTDLDDPARPWPIFDWSRVAFLLEDLELARAIAYRWLAPTGAAASRLRAAASATTAWFRLLDSKRRSPAIVRRVTAFLVHMCCLLALEETNQAELDAESAIIRNGASDAASTLFLAIPDVARAVDPSLGAPPGIVDDDKLARRWRAHRKQVASLIDESKRADVQEKLENALGE